MSAKLMGQVWELRLSHSKQLVLLALADHAHDDGTHCYPGIPYLAWKTGYTERNVTRILAALEEDELIESEGKQGGRGRVAGYVLKLEKGDRKDTYKPRQVSQRVTSRAKNPDNSDKKGDKPDKKGDKSPRAEYEEPSGEPPEEPSDEEGADAQLLPDDATTQCLLVLKQVKGFPRDQADNALYLMELRNEFPYLDPVAICKAYRAWMKDNPNKTKNYRSRLRTFFERQERDRLEGKPYSARASPHAGSSSGASGATPNNGQRFTLTHEMLQDPDLYKEKF